MPRLTRPATLGAVGRPAQREKGRRDAEAARVEQARHELGRRIQLARSLRGYESRASFARDLGVDQTTVYRWEKGTRAPEFQHFESIARLCGTTTDYLLRGVSGEIPPALAAYLDSPRGRSATAATRAFLASLPLGAVDLDARFYDLLAGAYEAALPPEQAALAAAVTRAAQDG